jgi:hypothetical protein
MEKIELRQGICAWVKELARWSAGHLHRRTMRTKWRNKRGKKTVRNVNSMKEPSFGETTSDYNV